MDNITATRLRELVAAHLCVDEESISPDSSFIDDLGANNLEAAVLVMAIEEAFGIEFGDEEADDALGPDGTFEKAVALVESKMAGAV